MNIRSIISFMRICFAFIANADNNTNLRKHEGHYYLISEINNHTNQEVMLESAIPGLLNHQTKNL